jgi:hypothetical protein
LSLLIFWFWLRGRFDQVDLAQTGDLSKAHSPLVASGVVITLLGVALVALIIANWEVCVAAATLSGAATAATAAAGVGLIGLTLIYAGMPQKRGTATA